MEVTAESNSQFVAFRRLMYSLSKQLSKEEAQAIVYIHFFEEKESLSSATTLDILCKLESRGIATSSSSDNLLELMKDLKRPDLASEVKDFFKKKKSKSGDKKSSSLGRKQKQVITDLDEDDDLILRSTLEAALVQATVLLQHMEVLQTSMNGSKVRKEKVKEIVTEAAQTSEALAERLRRAEVRVHQPEHDKRSSSGSAQDKRSSSGSVSESPQGDLAQHREGAGENFSNHRMMGYVNTQHTDRFSKLMSSSVPNNLGQLYEGRAPSLHAVAETSRQDAKDEKEEGSTEESDEDDYESMNPGVMAADIEAWEERRKSLSVNDRSSRVVHPVREGSVASPVHYTRVMVPAAKPTLALAKVQQYAAGKRNSMPINYTPVFYTKQGSDPKPSTLIPIPEGASHLRKTGVSKLTQSVTNSHQHGSDDNYTTLHPRGRMEGSNNGYKSLDRNSVSPLEGYMAAVQRADSRS